MKRLILIILLPLLLSSCYSYRGVYHVGLTEVEKPKDSTVRFGESTIVPVKDETGTKYSYSDEAIEVVWLFLEDRIAFTITNKTDNSMKIVWDEVVFIDEKGQSNRVFHSGVKYIDRNSSQPPTVVVRGATVSDVIIPTDNAVYTSGQYGGWSVNPLFESRFMTQEEMSSVPPNYFGKKVQIYFPLEIEGVINEFVFIFEIEEFLSK